MQLEQAASAVLTAAAVVLAKKHRALDNGGIIAALAIAAVLIIVEAKLLLLMMLFFFTSSAFTFLGYKKKEQKGAAERKGGRSATQVLCSGAVPALLALTAPLTPLNERKGLIIAAAATIAYANADTWASEIGSLSRSQPVLITRPRTRVPAGVSGGITTLGELGAVAGSAVIAFAAELLQLSGSPSTILVFALGWTGELLDAVIGAIAQVKYKCPKCGLFTDKEVHTCGTPTVRVAGSRLIKNEVVNLLTEVIVSSAAFALTLRCL